MLPEATAPSQDWASFVDALIKLYPGCDASSVTIHHVHHRHSYCPIITTALTAITKPDSIPLCPTIPDALSTTPKPNTDPNDITITNPETDHIHHHITDPNTRTDITTTSNSDIQTNIDSNRPTTNTNTITLTVTDSDSASESDYRPLTFDTVAATDNLANTTLATNTISDRSSAAAAAATLAVLASLFFLFLDIKVTFSSTATFAFSVSFMTHFVAFENMLGGMRMYMAQTNQFGCVCHIDLLHDELCLTAI
ncbi:hypothetical protein OG21DRAFT_1487377 [Imleria badia]|nr:hypothetical protein OG21DRAFT_1487377 [Imleria badia]